MHSVGGSWNDGMAIFDAIQLSKSYVTIISYGQAESMSSVILQAADKRVKISLPECIGMVYLDTFLDSFRFGCLVSAYTIEQAHNKK